MQQDERVEVTSAAVGRLERRDIRHKRIRTGTLILFLTLILVAVVVFGMINSRKQDTANRQLKAAATCQRNVTPEPPICSILRGVQSATDPNSAFSRANAAKAQQELAVLIACLENHEDRLIASALGRPAPSLQRGCPNLPNLKAATMPGAAHGAGVLIRHGTALALVPAVKAMVTKIIPLHRPHRHRHARKLR